MKAVVITKAGGPEVLQIQELADPHLEPNEVRIFIKAAGINRSDILTRENPDAYGANSPAAKIPGLEVSGEIIEVGSQVLDFKKGDTVCALVAGGGYSTQICVDARLCLPVPKGLSVVEAAALPEVLFTVWFNVWMLAKIKSGDGLLIHGGTSGIGIMGLQMAKALGIKTYTTAGTAEKVNFIKQHKLAKVINYKETDFEAFFKDDKIDVILDMVGGDYTQKNLNLLAPKGRLVNINGMKSLEPQINLWTIMSKQLSFTGSLLKPQSVDVKAAIASDLKTNIWPLIASGTIKPVISKTFKFEEVGQAHQLMERSTHIGKILVAIND